MPRQIRIQYPGAICHVMARGDRREAIFERDWDRECFLKTFGEGTGWIGEGRPEEGIDCRNDPWRDNGEARLDRRSAQDGNKVGMLPLDPTGEGGGEQ